MGHFHVVQRGDTLSRIASRNGLPNWRVIYDHPRNAAFRARHPDPNLIYPGDQVFIPIDGHKHPDTPASTGQGQPAGSNAASAADEQTRHEALIRASMDLRALESAIRNALREDELNYRLFHDPRYQLSRGKPPPSRVPQAGTFNEVRPGTISDIVDATLAYSTVRQAVDQLKEQAVSQVRRNWDQLSRGERAVVITHTAVLGAAGAAGIATSDSARQAAYNLIRDRRINVPVPRVPGLSLQFQTGDEHRVELTLDIAELLKGR